MKYVYILLSVEFPGRYYVGVTGDLKARLAKHNARAVRHTAKFAPWAIKTYLAFSDEAQALAFERQPPDGRSQRSAFSLTARANAAQFVLVR